MWPYPKVIAHRGGGTLAPENTLAALRCGLAHGYRAVEFDVMLAADRIPVLMHDVQLGRTVAGSDKVPNLTSAQLARCDAGAWFGDAFRGEPMPTLAQAVEFCRLHGIWMNIEIKPAPGHEQETGQEVARFMQAWLATHGVGATAPLFSSFSFAALQAARAVAPGIAMGLLCTTVSDDWRARLEALDAVALHTNAAYLTRAQAAAVKEAGYGLFCYTVNTPARARELLDWGVDAFCTDRLDLIPPDFADPPV